MTIITNYTELPEQAIKRQTIVVLKEKDFNEAMKDYETGSFLLDENICYIIEPSKNDIAKNAILAQMEQNNQLTSGNILVQDLENSELYLPFDKAVKNNIFAQMEMFKTLCQALGAKKFEISIKEKVSQKNIMSGNTKINIEQSNIGGEIKNNFAHDIAKELELEAEFEGKERNLTRAKTIVEAKIFDNNPNIIAFYNSAISTTNPIKRQKCTFSLAEQTTKSLKALANLDVPIFKTIASANLELLKEVSTTLEVTYEVTFAD